MAPHLRLKGPVFCQALYQHDLLSRVSVRLLSSATSRVLIGLTTKSRQCKKVCTEIGSTALYAHKLVSQPRENLKMWISCKENIFLELQRVDEVKLNIKM